MLLWSIEVLIDADENRNQGNRAICVMQERLPGLNKSFILSNFVSPLLPCRIGGHVELSSQRISNVQAPKRLPASGQWQVLLVSFETYIGRRIVPASAS